MIRRFLLVDDDQDDTDLFHEALRNIDNSIEFHSAQNGKEVLKKLSKANVDPEIIFLDINMPEMNGWECLTKLKSDHELKHIPVVMYSTSSSHRDGNKAISLGALGFLEKPPSYLKLKEFLEKITNSSNADLAQTLKQIEASKAHRLVVAA